MKFEINEPDDIMITMTHTMELKYWHKLKDQLRQHSESFPALDFCDSINDLIKQCEKEFYTGEEV